MTNYSLADMRKDIEEKFAPLELDTAEGVVKLRNITRLNDKDKAKFLRLLSEWGKDEEDKPKDKSDDAEQEEDFEKVAQESFDRLRKVCQDMIILIAETPAKGRALVKEIGDDLSLLNTVLGAWMEHTQLGEAFSSANTSNDSEQS